MSETDKIWPYGANIDTGSSRDGSLSTIHFPTKYVITTSKPT